MEKNLVLKTNRIKAMLESKIPNLKQIPKYLAERLVKDSAYWYGHPKGKVRAPKHADNVVLGPIGWEVEFGANKFLIGMAIEQSKKCVLRHIEDSVSKDVSVNRLILTDELNRIVRGAVSNYQDEVYMTLWGVSDGHMRFGTQSICLKDFTSSFIEMFEIGSLCND